MIVHGQIADADAHALATAGDNRIDRREHLGVEGPEVEFSHHRGIRPPGARMQRPVVQQQGVVAVDALRLGLPRMNDEQPHHAYRHLHHLIGMRVVHVGAVLAQRELVDIGFAGLDVRLAQATHTIHARGQIDAVPVDGGVLGQAIGHQDAHPIAFVDFDRRPRRAAVVTPALGAGARRKFVFDFFRHQVEFLDPVFHLMGQGPAIQRAHLGMAAWATGSGFGQRRGRHGRRQRGGAGVQEEITSIHGSFAS